MSEKTIPPADSPPADGSSSGQAPNRPAPGRQGHAGQPVETATQIAPVPASGGAGSVPPAPLPGVAKPAGGRFAAVPVGTIINNNYEVLEQLSAGGMGEVFRGINTFSGDAVAIKIVLQSLAHDEKVATLFKREARVLCQLSDQAIVRYYNFVHDAALDRFCLIMEFIDGNALSDHMRDVAPLSVAEARRLIRRLARGLSLAHAREVIHRDLSPDNVMLRGNDIDDAVLIDFGIAKSTEMAESTLFGQMAGKFKYVSPEQLGHFGGHIGPRTDIYGLALMIAAALRGVQIDMGGNVAEAVNARRSVPPLDGVAEELRPLLAHMLEPDPAARPASMADVLRLLDHPEMIPPRYGAATGDRTVFAAPLPRAGSARPQPTGAPAHSLAPGMVSSLRQPPGAGVVTGVPGSLPVGSGIGEPLTPGMPPNISVAPVPLPPPPVRRLGLWAVLGLVALVAVGGVAALQMGAFDPPPPPPATTQQTSGSESPFPAPDPATRQGFLAGFEAGDCAYASRIDAGPQTGMIEVFAPDPSVFRDLPGLYADRFGSRPDLIARAVPDPACPAVALARLMQTSLSPAPVMALDSGEMGPGGAINGRISERRARPLWLALITPEGAVHNLTPLLSDQADGSAVFSFGLKPAEGDAPAPHLLLAIASDEPLVSAAAAQDGVAAAELLPLVRAEIEGRGGKAAAALGYFDQLP